MKQILLAIACMSMLSVSQGQLKAKVKCPPFEVDILEGKVNGLKPDRAGSEIKGKLPCFTSSEEEAAASKCGGTIFYKDRDIYFFTGRDYIEIGPNFKGKLSVPLLGTKRGGLFKVLGHPKIKDDKWDAFQTAYGTLVLYYNAANKVNKIQFSTKGTETLSLCE